MAVKLTEEEQEKLNRKLFEAIKNNDLSAVKATVEAGINVNAKGRYGNPLLSRIMSADIKFLKYLLEKGANPDIQNSIGWTALHKAVLCSNMNKVKLLLKYKANMYIKDKKGETPFNLAFNHEKYDIAELFISAGYVPSEEDMQEIKDYKLLKAINSNNLYAIKEAIATGANVNAEDGKGSPLLLNVHLDINVLRYLLENGVNPNMRNEYKWSLLHNLSREGAIDSIKLLLEYKANAALKDKWGYTPFAYSLLWEHYEIAELFVVNGYVPTDEDFQTIKDRTKRESLKTRFKSLAGQVQEHKAKLTEKAKAVSQEFAYADEIIEM